MDYIIKRSVIQIKDTAEYTLVSLEQGYPTIQDAIEALDKLWKADKAMYRLAIQEAPVNTFCDDCHDNASYMFRIGNVVIEGELVDAKRYARNIFGLEEVKQ